MAGKGPFARSLLFFKKSSRPMQISRFLSLPAEIRLLIYNSIFSSKAGYPTLIPHLNPLYPLLFACQLVRQEITPFFYPTPSSKFSFTIPSKCTTFFSITETYTPRITSLTIHLPANKTNLLYPILAFVPNLQHLSIHLHTSHGGCFTDFRRQDAIYNLPRRNGLSYAGKLMIHHRNKGNFWYRLKPESFATSLRPFNFLTSPSSDAGQGMNYFRCRLHPDCAGNHFEWSDEHSETHVRLARKAHRWGVLKMPLLEGLRHIAIYGRPVGAGRFSFELGVLHLYLQMQEKANLEGKKLFLGHGRVVTDERAKYFDVCIAGEIKESIAVSTGSVNWRAWV